MERKKRLADRVEAAWDQARREPARPRRASWRPAERLPAVVAGDWIANVVTPKLEILAKRFPSSMPPSRYGSSQHVAMAILPTRERPWQAMIGVTMEEGGSGLRATLAFSLMPDPGERTRRATLDVPADNGGLRAFNEFLDEGLVGCVRDYLGKRGPERVVPSGWRTTRD